MRPLLGVLLVLLGTKWADCGLLGAGYGTGSCAAYPFRSTEVQWAYGCPHFAPCCSEFGFCRPQSEWDYGNFRDCNGVSNGTPLPAETIEAEAHAGPYKGTPAGKIGPPPSELHKGKSDYHPPPHHPPPHHPPPHHPLPHHPPPHHPPPYGAPPHHLKPHHPPSYGAPPHHPEPHHPPPHGALPHHPEPHHPPPYGAPPHHPEPDHPPPYVAPPHHPPPHKSPPPHYPPPHHLLPHDALPHHSKPFVHHSISLPPHPSHHHRPPPHHLIPHHPPPHHPLPHHSKPFIHHTPLLPPHPSHPPPNHHPLPPSKYTPVPLPPKIPVPHHLPHVEAVHPASSYTFFNAPEDPIAIDPTDPTEPPTEPQHPPTYGYTLNPHPPPPHEIPLAPVDIHKDLNAGPLVPFVHHDSPSPIHTIDPKPIFPIAAAPVHHSLPPIAVIPLHPAVAPAPFHHPGVPVHHPVAPPPFHHPIVPFHHPVAPFHHPIAPAPVHHPVAHAPSQHPGAPFTAQHGLPIPVHNGNYAFLRVGHKTLPVFSYLTTLGGISILEGAVEEDISKVHHHSFTFPTAKFKRKVKSLDGEKVNQDDPLSNIVDTLFSSDEYMFKPIQKFDKVLNKSKNKTKVKSMPIRFEKVLKKLKNKPKVKSLKLARQNPQKSIKVKLMPIFVTPSPYYSPKLLYQPNPSKRIVSSDIKIMGSESQPTIYFTSLPSSTPSLDTKPHTDHLTTTHPITSAEVTVNTEGNSRGITTRPTEDRTPHSLTPESNTIPKTPIWSDLSSIYRYHLPTSKPKKEKSKPEQEKQPNRRVPKAISHLVPWNKENNIPTSLTKADEKMKETPKIKKKTITENIPKSDLLPLNLTPPHDPSIYIPTHFSGSDYHIKFYKSSTTEVNDINKPSALVNQNSVKSKTKTTNHKPLISKPILDLVLFSEKEKNGDIVKRESKIKYFSDSDYHTNFDKSSTIQVPKATKPLALVNLNSIKSKTKTPKTNPTPIVAKPILDLILFSEEEENSDIVKRESKFKYKVGNQSRNKKRKTKQTSNNSVKLKLGSNNALANLKRVAALGSKNALSNLMSVAAASLSHTAKQTPDIPSSRSYFPTTQLCSEPTSYYPPPQSTLQSIKPPVYLPPTPTYPPSQPTLQSKPEYFPSTPSQPVRPTPSIQQPVHPTTPSKNQPPAITFTTASYSTIGDFLSPNNPLSTLFSTKSVKKPKRQISTIQTTPPPNWAQIASRFQFHLPTTTTESVSTAENVLNE